MPKMSIRQFRAALGDAAHDSGAMRAYREITRRRRATAGLRKGEWGTWAGGDGQPVTRLAAWGDWAGPPGNTAKA